VARENRKKEGEGTTRSKRKSENAQKGGASKQTEKEGTWSELTDIPRKGEKGNEKGVNATRTQTIRQMKGREEQQDRQAKRAGAKVASDNRSRRWIESGKKERKEEGSSKRKNGSR